MSSQLERVEWVRMHEARAIGGGCAALTGGLLRVAVLCSLAGQLSARAAASADSSASAGSGSSGTPQPPPPWHSAYAPYAFVLWLLLCCTCCACLGVRSKPARGGGAHGHPHENGHEKALAAARRRVAAHEPGHSRAGSGSSEGTSPLLGGAPSAASSRRGEEEGATRLNSPHLL
jgi:hypothetical protein